MRDLDFRIKGMGESFADVTLDVVTVSAGGAQIVTVRKGRGDNDSVLRPSVIASMLIHVVKRGLKDELVGGACALIQCGASVKAAAGRQVIFHKVAQGLPVVRRPFGISGLVATGSGLDEGGKAGVEFRLHNRRDVRLSLARLPQT